MNSALQSPRAVVAIVRPLHRIVAHPTLFSQCVSNLLDNAAKFVAPGHEPRIIIRSEVVDANDPLANSRHRDLSGRKLQSSRFLSPRYVRIWVEDNGIGMDGITRGVEAYGFGNIQIEGLCCASAGNDLSRDSFCFFELFISKRNMSAVLCKFARDCRANPLCSAGHDGHFASQFGSKGSHYALLNGFI